RAAPDPDSGRLHRRLQARPPFFFWLRVVAPPGAPAPPDSDGPLSLLAPRVVGERVLWGVFFEPPGRPRRLGRRALRPNGPPGRRAHGRQDRSGRAGAAGPALPLDRAGGLLSGAFGAHSAEPAQRWRRARLSPAWPPCLLSYRRSRRLVEGPPG